MDVVDEAEVPHRRGLKIVGILALPLALAASFFTYPHQSKAQVGRQIPQSCAKTLADFGTINAGGLDCTGRPRAQCAI